MHRNRLKNKNRVKTEKEYRCFFFVNMYMAGVHAGIQAQHAITELEHRYMKDGGDLTPEQKAHFSKIIEDYREFDRTTVVLNGGMQGQLNDLIEILCSPDNQYPWADFCESEYALNGALTCVAVILPKSVYGMDKEQMKDIRERDAFGLPLMFEEELMLFKSRCNLVK